MSAAASDTINFDPYARDFAENPYPIYQRLRDEAPVYHQKKLNVWILSRYEDVWKAHADAQRFSNKGGVTIEGYEAGTPVLLAKDGTSHALAKAMMVKLFSRSRMAALETFIRGRAVELLERAAEKAGGGEVNLVKEFSVQLPLDVISELLGIPESLQGEIHHLSNLWVMRGENVDLEVQQQGMLRLIDIYRTLAKERRAAPKDDPISMLVAAEVKDENGNSYRMDDDEIAFRFNEMGFAGHETVAKAIPNGLMAFSKFPGERRKLAADLSLMPKTVLEIVRYDPPSQLQGRTTNVDVTLHGVTIPTNTKVMLATGAAVRDERAFPDPDRFDIERELDGRTVSFGHGVHKCLGVHLASQEIAIAMEELFQRFPDWQVFPERSTRSVLSNVRGVSELPVNFGRHA